MNYHPRSSPTYLFFIAAAAVSLATAACADEVEIALSGSASGQGVSSSAGSGGSAGAGGDTTGAGGGSDTPFPSSPAGHFMVMQPWIGDCINAEEWLTFGPEASFTHTFVNRDFCGPHFVEASSGSFSSDGRVFEATWAPQSGSELRRNTYAIIDPFHVDWGWPPIDGYEFGTAALNRMAYYRAGKAPTWLRDDRRSSQSEDGSVYDVAIAVDVSLDAPLAPPPMGSAACAMTVSILITTTLTSGGEPPATLDETFSFPCKYGAVETHPWIKITGDGFENSPQDGSWSEYLEQKGIWKKYPSLVTNPLYDAFRPVLFYVPSDDTRLFHDVSTAWYQEMKSPPPSSVD